MARGGGESGINTMEDPKRKAQGEAASETITLREFGGVNVQSPREDIADNEFAWLEEVIPVASGNLVPVLGPSAALVTIAGEVGAPTLVLQFSLAGVDNQLAVWTNSGNAWIGRPVLGATWVKIATGLLTSGKTAATPWSNTGVLIVDPVAGYYDYGVTAANTLTNLSGQIYSITATAPGAYNTVGTVPNLRVIDTGGSGSGATVGASASVYGDSINAAGTGYSPGDVIVATGGTLTTSSAAPASQRNQATTLTVLTVNGSGAVLTYSITSPGYYQVAPASPYSFVGGAGTGFKLSSSWTIGNPFIITVGSGYVTPVVQGQTGGGGMGWVNYAFTVLTSGTILGSAIASYAGRAWIAIGRTVQFTDAGSYSSFANSGSSFTINDSYLHNNITALFAANNYLYIAGDDSIDILSNVTVVNGIAQFSRVNASSSIGITQPLSIFPFQRALAFANNSGFYLLSGATPEKVSDRLDGLIAATNFASSVYGCQVMIDSILCAAFLITFTDSFIHSPSQVRSILAVLFRGKWWFTAQRPASGLNLTAVTSYPLAGLAVMVGWAGNALYSLAASTNINPWFVRTKLWDLSAPLLDKQALLAGIGVVLNGAGTSGLSVTVDTEAVTESTTIGASFPSIGWVNNANATVQWINNANQVVIWESPLSGYQLLTANANTGGGKYLGLTLTGNANTAQIRLIALEASNRRRW